MIVQKLRDIETNYLLDRADDVFNILKRQKLGYSLLNSFNCPSEIIESILLENVVNANLSLQPSENIRVPFWTTKTDFSKFIFKIQNHGSSNFS